MPPRKGSTYKGITTSDVVSRYKQGQTMNQIAYHLDITRQTVAKHLSRAGIEPRPRGSLVEDEKLATMKELRAGGMSYGMIARQVGLSDNTVRKYLRENP